MIEKERDKIESIALNNGNPIPFVHEEMSYSAQKQAEPEKPVEHPVEAPPDSSPEEERTDKDGQPDTTTQEPEAQPVVTETTETPKRYTKLEQDVYKERERRRKMQAENETLKTRLESLESSVHGINSQVQDREKVKKIQEKLGIDEESARKLAETIREFSPAQAPPPNPMQSKMDEFRRRSERMSEKYEDWMDVQPEMVKRFEADFQIDPEDALANGPLYYYNESKRFRDPESLKAEGRAEMATKLNSKNLAMSESSRNSLGKPSASTKWTQARVREVAADPVQYRKYRDEILNAISRGEVT